MNLDTTTLLFLFSFGSIGSIDEFFFHHLKHKLFFRIESFHENVMHTVRFLAYAIIFLTVANLELRGFWSGLMLVVLACDCAIGILDILTEAKSRELLGGLSNKEYLLHMCLSFNLGIFYLSYVPRLISNFQYPASITFVTREYQLLQYGLNFMGISSVLMFITGCYLLYRIKKT